MYHYVEDKEFLKLMKRKCSGIINQLVQMINNEGKLSVEAHLVGSGAKNLITQNENQPIDLDYNLCINWFIELESNDCDEIKEYIRKCFNKVLSRNGERDCNDSTSALTTKKMNLGKGYKTQFSIDLCIITEDNDKWYRLIHKKTGFYNADSWMWNEGKRTNNLLERVEWLKENYLWNDVRETYLNKKNMYLVRNDYNHPSFICYIEAVNEIYNKYN